MSGSLKEESWRNGTLTSFSSFPSSLLLGLPIGHRICLICQASWQKAGWGRVQSAQRGKQKIQQCWTSVWGSWLMSVWSNISFSSCVGGHSRHTELWFTGEKNILSPAAGFKIFYGICFPPSCFTAFSGCSKFHWKIPSLKYLLQRRCLPCCAGHCIRSA